MGPFAHAGCWKQSYLCEEDTCGMSFGRFDGIQVTGNCQTVAFAGRNNYDLSVWNDQDISSIQRRPLLVTPRFGNTRHVENRLLMSSRVFITASLCYCNSKEENAFVIVGHLCTLYLCSAAVNMLGLEKWGVNGVGGARDTRKSKYKEGSIGPSSERNRANARNVRLYYITIRIGSTPTLLYFDLYLYSAHAAHYAYFTLGYTQLISSSKFELKTSIEVGVWLGVRI